MYTNKNETLLMLNMLHIFGDPSLLVYAYYYINYMRILNYGEVLIKVHFYKTYTKKHVTNARNDVIKCQRLPFNSPKEIIYSNDHKRKTKTCRYVLH